MTTSSFAAIIKSGFSSQSPQKFHCIVSRRYLRFKYGSISVDLKHRFNLAMCVLL